MINALSEENRVSVTLNGGATFPNEGMPNPTSTYILGTTSNFHLFLECESPDSCDKRMPIVIPSANIASLEFKKKEQQTDELTDLSQAIDKLDQVIEELTDNPDPIQPEPDENSIPDDVAVNSQLSERLGKLTSAINSLANTIRQGLDRDPPTEPVWVPIVSEQITVLATNLGDLLNRLAKRESREPFDSESGILLSNVLQLIEELSKTSREVVEIQSQCPWEIREIDRIGPFESGESEILQTDDRESSDPLIELFNWFEHSSPQNVLLIGRVDRNPLSTEEQGSEPDRELARRRGNWIKRELLKHAESEELDGVKQSIKRATVLTAGPSQLRFADPEDRVVEVWACVAPGAD